MEKISKLEIASIVNYIKKEIKTTQVRTARQVNGNLIMLYFRVGKVLYKNSLNDSAFMRKVAIALKLEYPDLKGFSERNLYNMREFYENYKDDETLQQLVAKISWGHNLLLLSKVKSRQTREFYMRATIENGWSRNVLAAQIDTGYHRRIGKSTNNFKSTLPPTDSDLANKMIKDPYIFDFLALREGYKEKELETRMIERIRDVLLELGSGWSFIGNQYKLTIGDEDYYIDLLFYHLKLRCYVVVELKATKFIPEFAGKMNFYLSAVDDQIKTDVDNPSIGLILCRSKNKLTANYSIDGIDKPIGISSYEINKLLPSEKDLNLYIDIEE